MPRLTCSARNLWTVLGSAVQGFGCGVWVRRFGTYWNITSNTVMSKLTFSVRNLHAEYYGEIED